MDGILPLWKPRGMTSHDCIYRLRKILNIKKMGHAGTLDPDVDGVLPICIGTATKVVEYMLESNKTYIGEITIGYATTTEDSSGEIIDAKAVHRSDLEVSKIDSVLDDFIGDYTQIPPMYSAVRVKGKRLYEYARAGEEVERPERQVNIYDLERIGELIYDDSSRIYRFPFRVKCSKGTYIRTLAVDVGKRLGFPAHMSQLTRIQSGDVTADQTLTFEEVEKYVAAGTLEERLLPMELAFDDFEKLNISEDLWKKVQNGAVLAAEEVPITTVFPVVFYSRGKAVAIYDKHPTKTGKLKPKKMLRTTI